jgi:DHA2 family multidrug resistance protein
MKRKYLEGAPLIIMTIGLGLGTFIEILDASIANVAIPNIAGDLAVATSQGTWVITSYAVSNAIVLPMTGWLGKRYGDVRVFVVSTVLFSFFSWTCGLSWSLPMLIASRIMQGAVAGTMIPLSQSLLLQNYPPEKSSLALAFWGIVVIVAPILGPVLGGWITESHGWSWIFYINVPIGILSSYLTWSVLKDSPSQTRKEPIDIVGFILLIIGVGALQITLDKGQELDWFNSQTIIILALVAFFGLLFFTVWDIYTPHPVVDFTHFTRRNFVIGTLACAVGWMLFIGCMVLSPLWLQTREGYTPYWAGVTLMTIGIFPLLLATTVGKGVNKWDPRLFTSLSFFLYGISFFWMGSFTTSVSLYLLMMSRLFLGLALAFYFIPLIAIAMSGIPEESLTSASGIFNFVRMMIGGGFGPAIFVTLWERREIFHHARLVESVNFSREPATAIYAQLQAKGLYSPESDAIINTMVTSQASILSLNDVFWLGGFCFLVMIPFIWLSKRVDPKNIKTAIID